MKNSFLVLILVINSIYAFGQEIRAGINYDYMYAKQWDKAIQTYNFSRPFLSEKQPLLMNGLSATGSYIVKSAKNTKHGINLAYKYYKSEAENENLNAILNLHFINPGYIFHYENEDKPNRFYFDGMISAVLGGLFRNVNGEPLEDDETAFKAFGIGGEVSLRTGYVFKLSGNTFLSPFIGVGYTPYYHSPNSEAILNQTKGLTGKNSTGILNIQAGMSIHFKKS